jgi:hypothetical protein
MDNQLVDPTNTNHNISKRYISKISGSLVVASLPRTAQNRLDKPLGGSKTRCCLDAHCIPQAVPSPAHSAKFW